MRKESSIIDKLYKNRYKIFGVLAATGAGMAAAGLAHKLYRSSRRGAEYAYMKRSFGRKVTREISKYVPAGAFSDDMFEGMTKSQEAEFLIVHGHFLPAVTVLYADTDGNIKEQDLHHVVEANLIAPIYMYAGSEKIKHPKHYIKLKEKGLRLAKQWIAELNEFQGRHNSSPDELRTLETIANMMPDSPFR